MKKIGIDFKYFPWSILWQPTVARITPRIYRFVLELGWIWPFMFTAGALLFTPFGQVWGTNPIHWRSFGSDDSLMAFMHQGFFGTRWADFSNHHTINLILEASLCFGLAGWFAKTKGTSIWKWGILATYGAILTWTIHEGMWWLTYWVTWKPDFIVFSGFGEMITYSLLLLTPVLGLYAPKRFLVWMLAFQVVWLAAGFPITESYQGTTAWYGTNWGDGWEVASWAWATIGFYFLERKGMLLWFDKISALVNHGPQLTDDLAAAPTAL